MWIIPRGYSPFAPDTEESNSVLKECLEQSESSLMWRSKPSPLRTWLLRWKRDKWFQRLSGRILKPSDRESFEAWLISSLGGIPASRSALPENGEVIKILDTFGLTSEKLFGHANPDGFFSKMLKDISVKGSYKSSPSWKKWRTCLSQEYSVRLKSAHHTNGNGCSCWPTASVPNGDRSPVKPMGPTGITEDGKKRQVGLKNVVKMWPTAQARDYKGAADWMGRTRGGIPRKESDMTLPDAVVFHKGGPPAPENPNTHGKSPGWLTPKVPSGGGQSTRTTPGGGLRKLEDQTEPMDRSAKLNPSWVEQLMGLEVGWTDLGYWGTE